MIEPLEQRLQRELDHINTTEKRDDKPYFDISFIKEYSGLYALMWILFLITLGVLMYVDTFGKAEVIVCCLIFFVLNFFFFFHINPSYKAKDIDKGAWKNCYTGDWYMEVHVREAFIEELLNGDLLTQEEKATLDRQYQKKGYLYFADIYRLRHK